MKPTCDARTGFRADEWGHVPAWCNTTVGLRCYIDRAGTTRWYCSHHEQAVKGRWTPEDELVLRAGWGDR